MKFFGRELKKDDGPCEIRSAAITGATGMLGASLARFLIDQGIRVVAVVRPGSKKRANLPKESALLTVVEANLCDFRTLRLPERVDAFFHFAWDSPAGAGRNDKSTQEANVSYALDAIDVAKRARAKVFLGAGSHGVSGRRTSFFLPYSACEPENEYGKAKLRTYVLCSAKAKAYGMKFVWTRILSAYGPYDNDYTMVMSAIRSMMSGERFRTTKGEQIWDYVFAPDAAKLFYGLAKNGEHNAVYIVSGGVSRPLREYVCEIRDAIDPEAPIGFGEIEYGEKQVMMLAGDIEKTLETAGNVEMTPFSVGIRKTIEWVKESSEA